MLIVFKLFVLSCFIDTWRIFVFFFNNIIYISHEVCVCDDLQL
jgi:hypothetical protein